MISTYCLDMIDNQFSCNVIIHPLEIKEATSLLSTLKNASAIVERNNEYLAGKNGFRMSLSHVSCLKDIDKSSKYVDCARISPTVLVNTHSSCCGFTSFLGGIARRDMLASMLMSMIVDMLPDL